jgi:acetylornithine deacetylase/succinyl-diaminopimelate desuccinylase-like protein
MGGSIPFLAELGKLYPETAIYGMGAISGDSDIHAPNEKLNLDHTKKVTCTISHIIAKIGAHK